MIQIVGFELRSSEVTRRLLRLVLFEGAAWSGQFETRELLHNFGRRSGSPCVDEWRRTILFAEVVFRKPGRMRCHDFIVRGSILTPSCFARCARGNGRPQRNLNHSIVS